MFNSSGVCAHTVAVATRKECLDAMVNWLRKRGNMNITKMAHAGLPKGAVEKGRGRRKFSAKSSTQNLKMLQDAGDELCTPRAGVTTKPKSLPTASHSMNLPTISHSETELPPYSTPGPPTYVPCSTSSVS